MKSTPQKKRTPEEDLLLAYVLKKTRAWLLAHEDHHLTITQEKKFQELQTRHRRGIPIPYLTGYREFYGRTFKVGPGVLVPRPETEHLVEEVLTRIPTASHSIIADVGTGTGCIGITVAAERPRIRVVATEISPVALHYAQKNVKIHKVRDRITLLHGNLLKPLVNAKVRPELIVANLPYLRPTEISSVRHEPRIALVSGADGMAAFATLFRQITEMGLFVPLMLEIDPRREKKIVALCKKNFPYSIVKVRRDLAGRARIFSVDFK